MRCLSRRICCDVAITGPSPGHHRAITGPSPAITGRTRADPAASGLYSAFWLIKHCRIRESRRICPEYGRSVAPIGAAAPQANVQLPAAAAARNPQRVVSEGT
jgi:hypothetical protein